MIDSKTIARELRHARQARIEADDTADELEELTWALHQSGRVWRRRAIVGDDGDFRPLTDLH